MVYGVTGTEAEATVTFRYDLTSGGGSAQKLPRIPPPSVAKVLGWLPTCACQRISATEVASFVEEWLQTRTALGLILLWQP